jgi:hypothetical protein
MEDKMFEVIILLGLGAYWKRLAEKIGKGCEK